MKLQVKYNHPYFFYIASYKKTIKMKSILKLTLLISIIFVAACKSDKSMNTDAKAPIAEKQAKELRIHNSTRTDNYFWMRLTDEQKTANEKD